jgi:hypothetical protein
VTVIRVTRSQPAPESLAEQKRLASGKYNCNDVVQRLKIDFCNKCYLCEESRISKFEIDHLHPHGGDKELKFDWNNLFYCCGHCNGTKSTIWPILDCSDQSVSVLSRLRYRYQQVEVLIASVMVESVDSDEATVNTATVMTRIFNGESSNRRVEAANILEKIAEQCSGFFRVVRDLAAGKGSIQDRTRWRNRISRGLSPDTSFTAIRAWQVVDRGLAEEFRTELERLGFSFS